MSMGRHFLWVILVFEVPDAFIWRWPSYATVILVSCATGLQAFTVCQSMLRLWKQFCKRAQEKRSTESLIYIQRRNEPKIRHTRAPTSASLDVTHKPNVNASCCSLSPSGGFEFSFVLHVHPTKEVLVVTSWRTPCRSHGNLVTVEYLFTTQSWLWCHSQTNICQPWPTACDPLNHSKGVGYDEFHSDLHFSQSL